MPNTPQFRQTLEDLVSAFSVHKTFEMYDGILRGEEGDRLQAVKGLGGKIANNPDLFLNETPQAIQNETESYVRSRIAPVFQDEALRNTLYTEFGDFTIKKFAEAYKKGLAAMVGKIPNDIDSEQRAKLTKQIETELELKIAEELGAIAGEFELSPQYLQGEGADKELIKYYTLYKSLSGKDKEKAKNGAADFMRSEYGLTENVRNFRLDWGNLAEHYRSIAARLLGKKLLTGEKGNYKVNVDLIKDAFNTPETLMTIAPVIRSEYQ